MSVNKKQIVIIGGGPAGLSAALWANDLGLDAVVFESDRETGGQLLYTYNPIQNYLGLEAADGSELNERFTRQLAGKDIETRVGSRINGINTQRVTLEDGSHIYFEYLVLATGIRRRTLNVPGEKEFLGKGILESGKRDASLSARKTSVVIGGGDAAFENALILAEYSTRVFLIHRSSTFKARREFIEKSHKDPRIELLTDVEVTAFEGHESLEKVTLRNSADGTKSTIDANTAVIRIGVSPNAEMLKGLVELDSSGYVRIESDCTTSLPNIYAIGDVANPTSPTISSAVGMGATAIKSISARIGKR